METVNVSIRVVTIDNSLLLVFACRFSIFPQTVHDDDNCSYYQEQSKDDDQYAPPWKRGVSFRGNRRSGRVYWKHEEQNWKHSRQQFTIVTYMFNIPFNIVVFGWKTNVLILVSWFILITIQIHVVDSVYGLIYTASVDMTTRRLYLYNDCMLL